MPAQDQRFDHILFGVANQHPGGVCDFLETIASFLARKTSFFTGDMQHKWHDITLEVFQKAAGVAMAQWEKQKEEAIQQDKMESEARFARYCEAEASSVREVNDDEAELFLQGDNANKQRRGKQGTDAGTPTPPAVAVEEELSKPIEVVEHEQDKEEIGKFHPNAGNGCNLPKYTWTQSLTDLELKIPLKTGKPMRATDVIVEIGKKSLKVGIKGQPPIVDGKLCHPVRNDECTWVLHDGKSVAITLEKSFNVNWWDRLMSTDIPISLRKIKPEPSRLGEMDGPTRSLVEKLWYDQGQKKLGLPTSDQQKSAEVLESFRKLHPELDFSRCKLGK